MSSTNPYDSPKVTRAEMDISTARDDLREIASAQRQVNFAVLFYLGQAPVSTGLAILAESTPWAYLPLVVIALCVFGFGAISVYRLAAIFQGKSVAIVHALGLLVPLLGLILLVSNSQRATKILQKNGVKVGLLGANPNSF